ncbi:dihydrofolate reductase family protein [Actinokineospora soli]|uniref:Dihydrofolate reductase family protein n=1 Tax=Actinokineospora soli TaxID=1048753 RepID=A0ABW2TWX8_9PSEU
MRKFKLQVQVSADGYMAGPNGEMDWMTMPWSDDLNAYLDAVQRDVDTIVLGRKLAEGFIPVWASRPEHEDEATIDFMNTTPKVVISRSLAESPWEGWRCRTTSSGPSRGSRSRTGRTSSPTAGRRSCRR